jgi:hypothetical protein
MEGALWPSLVASLINLSLNSLDIALCVYNRSGIVDEKAGERRTSRARQRLHQWQFGTVEEALPVLPLRLPETAIYQKAET